MSIEPLSPINESWKKIIFTDASQIGWGAVLCQVNPDKPVINQSNLEICQYASGLWDKTQQKWPSIKRELRAVCLGIDKFRDFIIYTHFTVKTDCKALQSAISKCDFEDGAMVRWIMKLSQYHFDIEFIEGKKNSFADMLSREFIEETGLEINAIRLEESQVILEDYKRS